MGAAYILGPSRAIKILVGVEWERSQYTEFLGQETTDIRIDHLTAVPLIGSFKILGSDGNELCFLLGPAWHVPSKIEARNSDGSGWSRVHQAKRTGVSMRYGIRQNFHIHNKIGGFADLFVHVPIRQEYVEDVYHSPVPRPNFIFDKKPEAGVNIGIMLGPWDPLSRQLPPPGPFDR
ncbi:MAG: hypothetical protein QM724_02090 [Flavobacteriales bacterium]